MKRIKQISIALALMFTTTLTAQQPTNSDFEILKNLELFEMVYKNIDMSYVDEPNPGHLMRVAIDAMLLELDPYSRYIPESQIEEFKLMTTGQYGGIGCLIQQQGEHVVISNPYEGWPAAKSGLMAGDILIEIDGKNVEQLDSEQVSDMLTGAPGRTVRIKVKRQNEFIEKSVVREEIKLSPVPYKGMVTNDVGYIKFISFTQTAYADVLSAFEE